MRVAFVGESLDYVEKGDKLLEGLVDLVAVDFIELLVFFDHYFNFSNSLYSKGAKNEV